MLRSILGRLLSCPTTSNVRRPSNRRSLRGLESLEERSLLAASITAVLHGNGALGITGTAGNDTITVRQTGSTIRIDGLTRTFSVPAVKKIIVDGLTGNDVICLDKAAGQTVNVKSFLYGGGGNDTVVGGKSDDMLWGNAGNDVLRGGAGKDILQDLSGHNQFEGGVGNDTLLAGAGRDTLLGGADNDLLMGGGGNDTMRGEDGADELYGEKGNDRLFGGTGIDRLDGGEGKNDWLDAGSASEYAVGGWNAYLPVIDGTTASDVRQGYSANTSICAALLAATRGGMDLGSRIAYVAECTYQVTLYDPVAGEWTEEVKFDGTWSYSEFGWVFDPLTTAEGEFWTVLYHRAYLQMSGYDPMNPIDMDSFPGDDLNLALAAVTGWQAGAVATGGTTPAALLAHLAHGDAVAAVTDFDHYDDVLMPYHAYVVDEVYQDEGGWQVRLLSPRGLDGITVQGANDGALTVSWERFQSCFTEYHCGLRP